MTETRALLLTDVVDSTKLSEALGDAAMAELWAKHDRVARDLLPVHHGREIDKTDGFLMLFEEASDAMAYAVAYHRALTDLGIAARAGLHVGEVILTENDPEDVARGAKPLEVDGIAKPTAARVMSVASGGQTLLTPSAVEALGEADLRLESHGHWRMKGVAEPLELFEVGDDDAPFQPPPDAGKVYRVVARDGLWLPVREVRHSLPAERDAFVGRSADLQTLHRLLGESRLVSVLGIGGTGKTRLVTRYGWTWLGDHPGGVWFCDLSEARSVEGIVSAVARALDVPLGKDDPVVQLGHAIAGRGPCLVVLDNFEQVASHAVETLGPWLDRAPDASFVVTTREVLGLPGETALPLAPLGTDESVDLFVARARQAKPAFVPDDLASIEALVALLDRLPLAIELAAARVRVMPPATLLERMSQRFRLLASRTGRPDRQSTLRAALDWSWELLDADEQSALAQLSVFEGGFTLDAAEAVLELEALWGMDAVQALVDKSLVRQVSEARFDLLVSVQEYVAEKLDEQGLRAAAEARHAEHYAGFGDGRALDLLDRHGGVAARRALGRELDNLIVACRRSMRRGAAEQASASLEAAWAVLRLRGPVQVAVALADELVRMPELPPTVLVVARLVRGRGLRYAGRAPEAEEDLEVALAAARQRGDRHLESRVLPILGHHYASRGRMDEAYAHLHDALALARELGDRVLEGWVHLSLGSLYSDQTRNLEALEHYRAALAVSREVGNRQCEGNVLSNMALLHHDEGRLEEAIAQMEAALAIHREVGNRGSEGRVLGNLGTTLAELGRLDEAGRRLAEAMAAHRDTGTRGSEAIALLNLGVLRHRQGRLDEARASIEAALDALGDTQGHVGRSSGLIALGLVSMEQGRLEEARASLEAALALHQRIGNARGQGAVLGHLGHVLLMEGRGADARAHLERGETLLRGVGDRLELGRLLCTRAQLEVRDGHRDAALGRLDEARALADELGAGPDSMIRRSVAEAARLVEQMS